MGARLAQSVFAERKQDGQEGRRGRRPHHVLSDMGSTGCASHGALRLETHEVDRLGSVFDGGLHKPMLVRESFRFLGCHIDLPGDNRIAP